ncbi:hypothetical protein [Egicoccus halophilus]|uniref:Uncharacterized protein n=1 Tax=Egicoccus halophilus TaxID=1670830 RepID=A0A8J3A584_9ACTN|nr:hypothetical protein [Egicoccus halophilus]GGI03303.1 hypothetical protein GCM10011354_03360 [Egicoccus halophilus]
MHRRRAVIALTAGVLALIPMAAHAAPPAHAPGPGCAAFGGNVAGLATQLGAVFGQTASGVATSGPGAFPGLVVGPEMDALC